jgi:transcriptional regulator with XRE-family HTH domain
LGQGISRPVLDEAAERLGMTSVQLQEIETEARQPNLTKFEKMGIRLSATIGDAFSAHSRSSKPPCTN